MKLRRMSSKKRYASFIAFLALIFSLGAVTPAQASTSIVWNHTGGSVPMFWGTRTTGGIKAWIPNSSHFEMRCWVDDQWYYGNYWSNRWFWGQSYATGDWGFEPASFVYYQTYVPHC